MNLYVDKALTALVAAKGNSFAASRLMGVVVHDQMSGKFPTLNDAHLTLHLDNVSLTGPVPTVDHDYTWTTFALDPVRFDQPIPAVTNGEPSIDALASAAHAAWHSCAVRMEYDMVQAMLAGATTSSSITGGWGTATVAAVVKDIMTMKDAVATATGQEPNVLAIGRDVAAIMRALWWGKTTQVNVVSMEDIAASLGLDEIITVGGAYKSSAGGSLVNQWTAKTALAYVRGPVAEAETGEYRLSQYDASFGKFIRFAGDAEGADGIEIVRVDDQTLGWGGVIRVGARYFGAPIITLGAAGTKAQVIA